MSYSRTFKAAYSEEVVRELDNGPDGPHGGILAMAKACDEGKDSFTYNGRTYVRHRPVEPDTAFARFIRKLLGEP
jgi:hypothetical protein